MLRTLDESYRLHNANIHRGVYTLAQEATERFEGARERIARFVGAPTAETIFTKNVTEAINLVAYSWGRANVGAGDTIVLTPMEHHANIVPWQQLAQEVGARLAYVELTDDGRLDLDSFDALLERQPKLVAVAHISNVLGTLNPVEQIVARAHAAGAVVLIDGAQAVPHLRVDVRALGADFYGFTGHKVYGPTGVGVLHGRRELLEAMPPFLTGGDMISSVDFESSTFARAAVEVRGGHVAVSSRRPASARPSSGSTRSAWRRSARTSTRSCAYALERARRGARADDLRPGRRAPRLARLVRARRRPPARRRRDPRPPQRLRARRPPLRAAADAPPRRPRDDARELRRAHHAR